MCKMSKGYPWHCDRGSLVWIFCPGPRNGQWSISCARYFRSLADNFWFHHRKSRYGYNLIDCLSLKLVDRFSLAQFGCQGYQEFLFYDMQVLNCSIICIRQTIFMTIHNHLPSHVLYSCHTICLIFFGSKPLKRKHTWSPGTCAWRLVR